MASFSSPYIKTSTAAVSRGADTLYLPYNYAPAATTFYAKFIDQGTLSTSSVRAFGITSAADASPRVLVFVSGGVWTAFHGNGTTNVLASSGASLPTIGQTVELRLILGADGSVRLGQSVNGGAETLGAASAANAFAGAWSAPQLYLNSGGTANQGNTDYLRFAAASGSQTLAAMQGYAG